MTQTLTDTQLSNRRTWIDALGNYEQCHGDYHSGDQYCVIGVALDLIDHNAWESVEKFGRFTNVWRGVECITDIQQELQKHYGLDYSDVDNFIEMNDQGETNFSQFSDLLQIMTTGTPLEAAAYDVGIDLPESGGY